MRILILLIFFCTKLNANVLIRGKVADSNKSKMILLEPILGVQNSRISKKEYLVTIDSNRHFLKALHVDNPIFLILFIELRPIWIFVEPNDTIDMEINVDSLLPNSLNKAILFRGKNALGNLYFNEYNYQPSWKIYDFEDSLKAKNFYLTNNYKEVSYIIGQQLLKFKKMFHDNQVTKVFDEYVSATISDVLISRISRYYLFVQQKVPLKKCIKILDTLYQLFPLKERLLLSSLYNIGVATNYYTYLAAKKMKTNKFRDSVIVVNSHKKFINKNFIPWLFAPNEVREKFWALALIDLKELFADKFGKRDVECYTSFYSKSKMLEYLSPPYFPNDEVENTRIDSSSIVILAKQTYETMEELYQHEFLNNALFVDLWASWCIPCKQEFKYNNKIDSVLEKYKIKKLYISIDMPATQKNALGNIYTFNLRGNHLFASEKLVSDLMKRFYDGKLDMEIPRYLIFNSKGVVINPDAPRPSDEDLVKFIESYFSN
jgi:thiol-disulfide isomerase/thioredoxin